MKEVKRRHAPYTKLKAYLNEIGMKQSDLAKLLNKSKSALNQNLNGTGGDFSLSEVRLICQTLNISADEFFIEPKVSNTKQSAS
jgi:transcriptional regulator with XRE-family HTH domain